MVYPKFTINTKAFNIASSYSYSPYYDIVWSFEYAISGNSNTEAGFTIFLMDSNYALSGGNYNIDLGYSGLSAFSNTVNLSAISPGVSGAIIAVGFDTTGCFPVSATSGSVTVRDGISDNNRIANSISVRSNWPTYSYNAYKINIALSSIDSDFKIVESEVRYKTIRARLGNVGRTLFVDYRYNPDDDFKPLLQQDINLNITSNTLYKAGASFATPISSNNINKVGNIYFKNFHTEGSAVSGSSSSFISTASSVSLDSNIPLATAPSIKPIEALADISNPISDDRATICPTPYASYGKIVSNINNVDVPIFDQDRYNFGYTLNVVFWSLTGTVDINLNRTEMFKYVSTDSAFIVYKNNLCSNWYLSSNSLFLTNSSVNPIGFYAPYITAIYL